jgi:hypothetical protein
MAGRIRHQQGRTGREALEGAAFAQAEVGRRFRNPAKLLFFCKILDPGNERKTAISMMCLLPFIFIDLA